jgi:hypothetical protein
MGPPISFAQPLPSPNSSGQSTEGDSSAQFKDEDLSASPSLKKQKTKIQTVIKEVGVPQEMYDALKQKLIEKESELKRVEESIYERE